MKQNDIQRKHKFQDICLCETNKVAVVVSLVSLSVLWRRILHEELHVLRETCDT